MHLCEKGILFTVLFVIGVYTLNAEPDPNFHIYLLFGQSNMAGGCNHSTVAQESIDRQPEDCDTTERVKVLAWGDCNNESSPCPGLQVNRTYDQWYTAFPPYHKCTEGLGPADYFGKTLLDSIREDIKIGFIPCALSGQNIAVFEKGNMAGIDEHTQPYRGGQRLPNNGYGWMVDRCKIAQESGVIKGILLHQGEANAGDGDNWVRAVKGIYDNLKQDLGIDDVPFIAGELIQDPAADPNAKNLNPYVDKISEELPMGGVASSKDLKLRAGDTWRLHFSCESVRELGKRYAIEFLKLADQEWVPRIGTVQVKWQPSGALTKQQVIQRNEMVNIFSLDGKKVLSIQSSNISAAKDMLQSGKIYLLKWKTTGRCNTMVGF